MIINFYNKDLSIIIPYRKREEHLKRFIPHIVKYFERDKLDKNITYSIHIIEQLGNEPFNRGKLLNCGYAICEDVGDYFCFHDIDYLPIWADYSYCTEPTHIIWHGLPEQYMYKRFFGGVCMFNRTDFEKINGFSNQYWGWGEEDEEARERCRIAGLKILRRYGTFQPLYHPHNGKDQEGRRNNIAEYNFQKRLQRHSKLKRIYLGDGLSDLEFSRKSSKNIILNEKKMENIFLHRVEI